MNDQIQKSQAVRQLMEMTDETVSAKWLAPILKMSPSVIIKYAKDGTWDQDNLGKFVISGGHVKFFRKDFLQKCGFMEPEKEEAADEKQEMRDMIQIHLLEGLQAIMKSLIGLGDTLTLMVKALDCMMTSEQRMLFEVKYGDDKKTAS